MQYLLHLILISLCFNVSSFLESLLRKKFNAQDNHQHPTPHQQDCYTFKILSHVLCLKEEILTETVSNKYLPGKTDPAVLHL